MQYAVREGEDDRDGACGITHGWRNNDGGWGEMAWGFQERAAFSVALDQTCERGSGTSVWFGSRSGRRRERYVLLAKFSGCLTMCG